VSRRVAGLGLALAAIPPAYAGFVYGWQLVSFAGLQVRLGEDLPLQTWGQVGVFGAQMVIIAAALLITWQGARAQRYGKAGIALAVAWLASAPLFVLMLRPF
jgi:hypothetical protein